MNHGKTSSPLYEAWIEWVASLRGWSYFFTGTVRPKEGDSEWQPGVQFISNRIEGFLHDAVHVGVGGFLVSEEGGLSSRWHAHGLLCGAEGSVRGLAALWAVNTGYVALRTPKSTEAVTRYCVKYILKDGGRFWYADGIHR